MDVWLIEVVVQKMNGHWSCDARVRKRELALSAAGAPSTAAVTARDTTYAAVASPHAPQAAATQELSCMVNPDPDVILHPPHPPARGAE